MKIVVTGGSGMIGKNLQDFVIENNTGYDWLFPRSTELNLLNELSIDNYIELHKPDFVIHLAANVGGLFKNLKYKVEMFRENILMNENLLHVMNKHNINNGIFCCSTCIFPKNPSSYPMTENMIMDGEPHESNDSYGYSKRLLYFQCGNYNKQYGRKYICISPCNLYGKYDNFNLEDSHVVSGLIHKFYLANLNGTDMSIKTGLLSKRQLMLSSDLCKILIQLINDFNLIDYKNIILSDDDVLITDVVKVIGNYFPNVKYSIVDIEGGQIKKTCSNEMFLSKYPNFKFTSLEDGVNETLKWFVNNYDVVRK